MGAQTATNLFLASVYLCAEASRPNHHSQIYGVVRQKIRDMSDDAFRKLVTSHVPILNSMTQLVIVGHARNTTDGRKGARHNGQRLAQRSSGKGEVVSARTGASLQKPQATRFWREDRGRQPSEDRVESHGEQIPARRAALSYAAHHSEMLPSSAGTLDICD